MTTLLQTNHELSLPGFLQFAHGLEVRSEDVIARGGGGLVSLATVLDPRIYKRTNRAKCVIKELNGDFEDLPARLRNSFNQEVAIMWLFRDEPNFARVFGYSTQPASILMQYYPGSLMRYIDKPSTIPQAVYSTRQVVSLLKQLAIAYSAMHRRMYSHSDIKPDNVLLDLDASTGMLVPYVTDFGISRLVDASAKQVNAFELSTIRGLSLRYSAPELLMWLRNEKQIDDLSQLLLADVFSFAIMAFELTSRQRTYS